MSNTADVKQESKQSHRAKRSTKPKNPKKSGESTSPLRTRVSASWTAVVVAAVLLILLVIFVAQNTQRSSVNFLWLHGHAPTAVVILIAAAAGASVVVIVAVARILQLRRAASRAEA